MGRQQEILLSPFSRWLKSSQSLLLYNHLTAKVAIVVDVVVHLLPMLPWHTKWLFIITRKLSRALRPFGLCIYRCSLVSYTCQNIYSVLCIFLGLILAFRYLFSPILDIYHNCPLSDYKNKVTLHQYIAGLQIVALPLQIKACLRRNCIQHRQYNNEKISLFYRHLLNALVER